MTIDYPNGPWKKLFSGVYDEYSLSLLFNQEGYIITEILNTEKTKAVLTISQIIGVFGDAETFVETIPRNAIFLLEHGTKSNQKYVLLQGDQEVLSFAQKNITDFVNDQFKKLKKDSKSIVNIANSYEITLKDYSELTSDMKTNIFSNPLSLFSFITQNKNPKNFVSQTIQAEKNEFFLGFYKTTNEKATEPTELFNKTFVFGQSDKCVKVLLENFSQNKINTIVFTYNDISNMKYPNESSEVQEKNKNVAIGFPLVDYKVGERICVNLQDLPNNSFQESIGLKNEELSEIISTVLTAKNSMTLDSLIKEVSEYSSEKYSSYNLNLIARIIDLVKQETPGIYQGDFSISDFFKNDGNLSNIYTIYLNKNNLQVSKAIIYNVLKKINQYNGKEQKIAIVLLNFNDFFSRKENDLLSKELFNIILNDNYNYYLFSYVNEIDVKPELLNKFTAKLSLLENDEIGITLKDAKPFRFVLRPTYSKV